LVIRDRGHLREVHRLVLVPGLGLGPEAYTPVLEALEGVSGTVVTLPGYGERAGRRADLRPEALARTLLEQLPTRGTNSRVTLVGHSASCQVVVEAARAAGAEVAAVVLVGPTTDPAAATWPRLAARWLRTSRHEDPRQVPALVRQYSRTGPGSMLRVMDAARRHRIGRALADCDIPVLVVRGRHDRICPTLWADRLSVGSRRMRVENLPVGAHMVPLTDGALVAGAVRRFLQEAV